jgi:hypothetical protein
MASIDARKRLGRQTMTALGAACCQNLAASVGRITCAEAKFAGTAEFRRAIRWFHGKSFVLEKAQEETLRTEGCQGMNRSECI